MGANAARHTLEILDNVGMVLGIEMLTAAQAIDLRPLGAAGLGEGTVKAYAAIRRQAAFMEHDRETSSDTNALAELIRSGEILGEISDLVRLG